MLPARVWLAVLFAAALSVRLYFAVTLFLNPDECLHVNAASSAQYTIYHHPPLMLWWLWAATLVSEQEWWLRLLPAIAGATLPIVTGLWLRQSLSAPAAWALAVFVAFSPNLVLLTVQVRGYSLALLATAAALYALERAFAEPSRRWLLAHFAALLLAILSEFMTAWVALAMGLYGLLRLHRERRLRPLARNWWAGQAACVGVYAVLYLTIVRPVADLHTKPDLIQRYLFTAFPQPGENWLWFSIVGSLKQLVYLASSMPGGVLAAIFLALGFFHWLSVRHSHALLVGALPLAALGAIFQFYPYGRSRHTVALGLVSLLAMGAGIESLTHRWRRFGLRLAAPAALLALPIPFPLLDWHNHSLAAWEKHRWEQSLASLERVVPRGSTILTDGETFQMLQTSWAPRHDRARIHNRFQSFSARGFNVQAHREWEWQEIPAGWVQSSAKQEIWLLDCGYNVEWAKRLSASWGAATIIDEHGVSYLARLRKVED